MLLIESIVLTFVAAVILDNMYSTMGETEITVDPMETMPLTSDQEPDLDPLKTGFTWYKAARSLDTTHKSGGHTWTISGHDMQILTSTVPPGEEIITEGTPTGILRPNVLNIDSHNS